jgi:His/Glu/Gln/Arg/opine family amino acid ABC transporter permease subunit
VELRAVSLEWLSILLPAASVTLGLSLLAIGVAVTLGFAVALGCLSPSKFLRGICRTYIELVRAVPLLVLLFAAYYGLGSYFQRWQISAFSIAVATIGLNEGAYAAEVYRSALLAIDRGQWYAGYSIGLSAPQTLLYVILPQFARIALQPTINMFIYVIKASALASLITVQELAFESQQLVAENFLPLQVYGMAALIYLGITVPLGGLVYLLGDMASRRFGERARAATMIGPTQHVTGTVK